MSTTTEFRKLINLLENKEEDSDSIEKVYTGPTKAKTAAGEFNKATVTVTGDTSGVYTRIFKTFNQITKLTKKVEKLQEEMKSEAKDKVSELFDVEDSLFTRVIATRSLIITMSKDQERQEKVETNFDLEGFIEGLNEILTDEMKPILEELIKSHTKITTKIREGQKGRLSVRLKKESISNDVWNMIKSFVKKVSKFINRFINRYDNQLNELKKKTGFYNAYPELKNKERKLITETEDSKLGSLTDSQITELENAVHDARNKYHNGTGVVIEFDYKVRQNKIVLIVYSYKDLAEADRVALEIADGLPAPAWADGGANQSYDGLMPYEEVGTSWSKLLWTYDSPVFDDYPLEPEYIEDSPSYRDYKTAIRRTTAGMSWKDMDDRRNRRRKY